MTVVITAFSAGGNEEVYIKAEAEEGGELVYTRGDYRPLSKARESRGLGADEVYPQGRSRMARKSPKAADRD